MHPLPNRTLRRLLAQYGPNLLDDPARVDALLADLCGPHHRERFLLVHALRERIPADLLAQPHGGAIHGRRLSQRLQRRYGFSDEATQWAIESWSLALDIAPLNPNTLRDGSHTALSIWPQRTLRQLLEDYGPELLNEPERADALLADLCGPYPRERFLLVHALRERIPTELLLHHAPRKRLLTESSAQPQGTTIYGQRLSQRLQSQYGFSAEAAQWAVEGCSLALNITPPAQDLTSADKPFGPAEELMLQILKHDPRTEAWVSAEVLARQKAEKRDAAEAAVHQKAEERDAAEATARQKAKERETAEAKARQKAEERDEAEATAHQKAKELVAAKAAARQKAKEQVAAEATAHQKAEERDAAKATAHQKAREQVAAEAAALQKAKELVTAEAAARQQAKKNSPRKRGCMELGRGLVVLLTAMGVMIWLIALGGRGGQGALIAGLALGLSALIGPVWMSVGLIRLIRRWRGLNVGLMGLIQMIVALGTLIGLIPIIVEPTRMIRLSRLSMMIGLDFLVGQGEMNLLIELMAVIVGLFVLIGLCAVIVGLISVMRRSRMPVVGLILPSSRR